MYFNRIDSAASEVLKGLTTVCVASVAWLHGPGRGLPAVPGSAFVASEYRVRLGGDCSVVENPGNRMLTH